MTGEEGKGEESSKDDMAENVRSFIAYWTVIVGTLTIAAFYAFSTSTQSKEITLIFNTMIGIVLGYYFGTKGAERIEQNAAKAIEVAEKSAIQVSEAADTSTKAAHVAIEQAEKDRSVLTKSTANLRQYQTEVSKGAAILATYEGIIADLTKEIENLRGPGGEEPVVVGGGHGD